MSLLQQKIFPQVCGFIGFDSLVCCKEEKQNIQEIRSHGNISATKCKEYYPEPVFGIAVVGGQESLAKEFPHMFDNMRSIYQLLSNILQAAIGFGESNNIQWLCGGSLISRNFILTAAHCLVSRELGPARFVRLGELDFATDQDDAQTQDFTVKKIVPHPDFRPVSGRYHDIGLIELDRDVERTQYVDIACLDMMRVQEDPQMIATGWGKTEFSGKASTHLLKINLNTVTNDQCQRFYQNARRELPGGIVDDLQICAGGKVMQDTCQGDSGGPLQRRNYAVGSIIYVYNIIGVTSFGKACGLSKTPGIYTRVYGYLPWIESIVWP
ncbi:hypothetical protein NQ318_021468 [Aromia moschata]|uniref:Peptidase S1 domain-containing protein n=1 Tax=Aromia moschata TaxID=1265417 RepID=A0AAV8ZCN8_9CUCU|nr:hypothetical protein NQ318_021468 [Aromia moschata]